MEFQNFSAFNEAKKIKTEDVVSELIKIFDEKPTIKPTDEKSKWPTEKDGLYSQSGIAKWMEKKGFKASQSNNAISDLSEEKKIKVITIKNYQYDTTYPYYYKDLTEDEVKKLKKEYEDFNKDKSEKDIVDKQERIKRNTANQKPKRKKMEKTTKKNESLEIKSFTQMMAKKLENEGIVKPTAAENVFSTGGVLPTAPKVKNISTFIDDIDGKILNWMSDKGVPISSYHIAAGVGIDVKDVYNVLTKLSKENKIIHKEVGGESFWRPK